MHLYFQRAGQVRQTGWQYKCRTVAWADVFVDLYWDECHSNDYIRLIFQSSLGNSQPICGKSRSSTCHVRRGDKALFTSSNSFHCAFLETNVPLVCLCRSKRADQSSFGKLSSTSVLFSWLDIKCHLRSNFCGGTLLLAADKEQVG